MEIPLFPDCHSLINRQFFVVDETGNKQNMKQTNKQTGNWKHEETGNKQKRWYVTLEISYLEQKF